MAPLDGTEQPNVVCCSYPGAGDSLIATLVESIIRSASCLQSVKCADEKSGEAPNSELQCTLRLARTNVTCDKLPESSKVIYLYRDPRDMALAQWRSSEGRETSGHQTTWSQFLELYITNGGPFGLWSDHFLSCQQATAAGGALLTLNFETVVEEGHATVRQIADFLGLQLDEQGVDRLAAEFSRATSSAVDSEEIVPANGWKAKFTVSDSDLFDKVLRSERKRLGLVMPYWPWAPAPANLISLFSAYEYQGVVFPQMSVPFDRLKRLNTYADIRDDDVFVWTYPKAGTHWVMDIVSRIFCDPEIEQTRRFKQDYMTLELVAPVPPEERGSVPQNLDELSQCPSPRTIGTHLPFRMMPKKLQRGTGKIIYVYRNPRDIAVSMFYMLKIRMKDNPLWTWPKFCELFTEGRVPFGPWWEHFYMAQQKKNLPNVLVLVYEDMKQDLYGTVLRVSKFLGKEISEAKLEEIAKACSIEETKKAKPASVFVRKGTSGDWKNHFTVAESERFEEKLQQVKAAYSLEIPY